MDYGCDYVSDTKDTILDRSYLKIDRQLIQDTDIVYDFNTLDVHNIPDGRFKILYKNIKWECFWGGDVSKNKDRVVVVLNGAGAEDARPTTFNRWSWFNDFGGRVFCIDDPMYSMYKIPVGWYFGNKEIDFKDCVADIVKKIFYDLGVSDLLFYGSSAGASSCLRVASKLNYGTVIGINPQIKIGLHHKRTVEAIENIISCNIDNDPMERDTIPDQMMNSKIYSYRKSC